MDRMERMWNMYSKISNPVYRGSNEDGNRRGCEKTELALTEEIFLKKITRDELERQSPSKRYDL